MEKEEWPSAYNAFGTYSTDGLIFPMWKELLEDTLQYKNEVEEPEEKIWAPLDKLNYIKQYLDDKVEGIYISTNYKVLIGAMRKLIADVDYELSEFEMNSVNSLFRSYEIPNPIAGEVFNGIVESLTFDDLESASFVFTGFRSEELARTISKDYRARLENNISSSTTLVIAKDPSKTTSKIRKAEDVGAKVVSLKDVTTLLKPNDPNKVWK